MTDTGSSPAHLTKAEREARAEQRRADAAVAIAEHEQAEQRKYANLARLRAERLAREAK